MRGRRVREEFGSVEDKEFVDAVGEYLLLHLALDSGADDHGMELHAELIGQLAAFGQKFLRNFLHGGAFNFTIYKYVVHSFVLFFGWV